MRKDFVHFIRYFIAGLLCMSVLFITSLDGETRNNRQVEAAAGPGPALSSNGQLAQFKEIPMVQLASDKPASAAARHQAPPPAPVQPTPPPPAVKKPRPKPAVLRYKVTAYYLHVRAEPNASSKILGVVANGDTLDVLKPMANGWLELKSGGYVSGNYAKRIPGGESAPSADKPASPAVAVTASAVVTPVHPKKPTPFIKSKSGLTVQQIAQIVKGTPLEDQSLVKAILEVEKQYGINSYFTIAVMELESGHGKSLLARTKNNLFGLNAAGGDSYRNAFSFRTKGDCVKKFGQIIADYYINKGLTSVQKIGRKYCSANSKWPALVMRIMDSDYQKVA